MITSKFSKNKPMCILLVLLTVHIIKGAIVHSTDGDGYIDGSFILTFNITPSFTGTAIITQDGTTRTTCFSTLCSPSQQNNVSFTPSGTDITLLFSPVSSSHQGSWECSNNGEISTYPFTPQQRPSSVGDKAGLPNGIIAVIVVVCVVVFILFLGGVAVALGYGKYITCGRRKVHVLEFKNDNEVTEIKNVVLTKSETKDIADVIPEQYDSTSSEWTHNGETLFKTKIERASTKHAGFYVCKIKGERLLKIQLMVLGTEETVYVEKGKDTFLGNDTPAGNTNAKWTHDGKLLTSMGMRGTRINIHNAVPKDTGLYVCTLAESSESFKHQLIVIDDALIIANPKLKSYMTTLSQ